MSEKKYAHLDLVRRPRRLRQSQFLRDLVEETALNPAHLIQPVFVSDQSTPRVPIESMPGMDCLSIEALKEECSALIELGIGGIALFPRINLDLKCDSGREALNPDGLVYRALRELRAAFPDFTIIVDIALDPYTKHGHDGLIEPGSESPLNDATVEVLAEMAVLAGQSGATMVAPSDMMDGRVGAIRESLDANGLDSVLILSYAAKFASAFYGPFRDAVSSVSLHSGTSIDKKTYQLNPANRREALLEADLDETEGADILMVKPAGPYLDIIREIRESTELPIAAYQVSGEYAQLMAAVERGWLDLSACRDESLIAIRRAGADIILSYFAKAYAESLAE
jgi:porphobilinogen synthase